MEFNLLKDRLFDEKIGVMLSGGPDSAILYLLLLQENDKLKYPMTIIPMCAPKLDGAAYYADSVHKLISAFIGKELEPILYIGNPFESHDKIVTNAIINVLRYDIVHTVYVADNITPPEKLEGMEPIRVRSTYPTIIQPFFDMTKDQILKLFFDLGAESILMETHTCTEQSRGRCGKCWQCNERAWGFRQLGYKDHGNQ